jgi:hypothetical protein
MPIFWLIIVIGTSQTPFHAGNFSDVEACKKAATEMVRGSLTGSTTGTGALGTTGTIAGPAPNVQYVCVEAGSEPPTIAALGTPTPRGKPRRHHSRR